jgi:hypothetical protein
MRKSMKIRWRMDPIPAPITKAKIVASVGVRDEIARWRLGVSKPSSGARRQSEEVKGSRSTFASKGKISTLNERVYETTMTWMERGASAPGENERKKE